jgi:hypothetical protein
VLPISVVVIAFDDPQPARHQFVADLPADLSHIQAIDAYQDQRWLQSKASDDEFAIGRGAAGCLLAHLDAWTALSEHPVRSQAGLVLESDAAITNFGIRWMGVARNWMLKRGANLLQVGSNRVQAGGSGLGSLFGTSAHVASQYLETKPLRRAKPMFHQAFHSGAHAYLVMPDYASWLATWNPDFKIPVDQWLHVLARDPRHRIFRSRQDLWTTVDRPSEIEALGR